MGVQFEPVGLRFARPVHESRRLPTVGGGPDGVEDGGKAEKEENDATEETGAGAVDDAVVADDAAVADPAGDVEAAKVDPKKVKKAPKDGPAGSTVTQDDITKIIVQKLKKDRTNNEKIGAILKTYGVAKVSELPAEKYEAFLTDLSQL